jgi:hypothetical protein
MVSAFGISAARRRRSGPIARIAHVRQPQHDLAQSALTLGSPMASGPIAGGIGGLPSVTSNASAARLEAAARLLGVPGTAAGGVTADAAWPGEVPCFRCGMRIPTDRGEVAVEDLRVGDRVRMVLGGTVPGESGLGETAAPIIWIGQRDVDCARHPKPRQV